MKCHLFQRTVIIVLKKLKGITYAVVALSLNVDLSELLVFFGSICYDDKSDFVERC